MDAEGETVQKSLKLLGFDVRKVDTIKVYRIVVAAKGSKEAVKTVENASRRLLANPVVQEYAVTVV